MNSLIEAKIKEFEEILGDSPIKDAWIIFFRQALTAVAEAQKQSDVEVLEGLRKDISKYIQVDNKRTGETSYRGGGQCRECSQFRDAEERYFNAALDEAIKQINEKN